MALFISSIIIVIITTIIETVCSIKEIKKY